MAKKLTVAATVAAPFTPAQAKSVSTAFVKLAKDAEGFAAKAAAIVAKLGTRVTFAQWDAQLTPALKAAFQGSGFTDSTVATYLSRFKLIGCACLSGNPDHRPQTGEATRAYLERVRPLLADYVFPDGVRMAPVAKSGTGTAKKGRKAGTRASNAKPKAMAERATGSAGSLVKDEGGTNAPAPSPAKSAALNLMGQDAAAADLLLTIVTKHRAAFLVWAKAQTTDASIPPHAKTPRVQRVAKAPETALGAALVAAKTKDGAKANGAMN